jgi:hypothetical protein
LKPLIDIYMKRNVRAPFSVLLESFYADMVPCIF